MSLLHCLSYMIFAIVVQKDKKTVPKCSYQNLTHIFNRFEKQKSFISERARNSVLQNNSEVIVCTEILF